MVSYLVVSTDLDDSYHGIKSSHVLALSHFPHFLSHKVKSSFSKLDSVSYIDGIQTYTLLLSLHEVLTTVLIVSFLLTFQKK